MTNPTLDRREILPHLFPDTDGYLFISGLAGPARDAAALTGDSEKLYTMAGTMGAAVCMGLGVAMSAPESRVAVVTGDGELLMNIGSLATVASIQPENLSIVVIDNGCHGETGGQPGHTARRTDLGRMAEGAGIASVKTITTAEELADAAAFLQDAAGPRLLVTRVTHGPPSDFSRNLDPAACRLRFRNAYLGSA